MNKLERKVITIINDAKVKKSEVIELPLFPKYVNCNINPSNPYHLAKFKKYYGLDDNVEIKFYDTTWSMLIFYKE